MRLRLRWLCLCALALALSLTPSPAHAQRGTLYQGPGGGWLEMDGGPNSHWVVGWVPKSPSGSYLCTGWMTDLGLAKSGLVPVGSVTIPPADANGNVPGGIWQYIPGPAGFAAGQGAARGAGLKPRPRGNPGNRPGR